MENILIPDAIELVSKAIEADKEWISLPPMQNKRNGCAAPDIKKVDIPPTHADQAFSLCCCINRGAVYSPISGKWTSLPPMQTKRNGCAAVSIGGKICVMGGHDGKNNLTSVEVYSPTSRKWKSLPPMQTKRSHCAAVSIGEQICVMGGYGGGSELSSVCRRNGMWEPIWD
eukprot:820511-Ditylum_brightwellii.AAC.1